MPGINMQIFLKSEYDDTPLTYENALLLVAQLRQKSQFASAVLLCLIFK